MKMSGNFLIVRLMGTGLFGEENSTGKAPPSLTETSPVNVHARFACQSSGFAAQSSASWTTHDEIALNQRVFLDERDRTPTN